MMVAAIDPGIDRVVAVFFDVAERPANMFEVAKGWITQRYVTTDPKLSLVDRLLAISRWMAVAVAPSAQRILIEQPTIFGAYARHRGASGAASNPRALALLYMAMGALITSGGQAPVELVRKPRISKGAAARVVRAAFADAGKVLPKKFEKDADMLDALFIGLWGLTTPFAREALGQTALALP